MDTIVLSSQSYNPAVKSSRESVLGTPELLVRVFKLLSSEELVVVALVCKEWSYWALDTKWRFRPVTTDRLWAVIGQDISKGQPILSLPIKTRGLLEKVNYIDMDVLISIELDGPVCPSLQTVTLEIAQSWSWDSLDRTMNFLQGPPGQRGMITVELRKRMKWLSMTRDHSERLGHAIPNLGKLTMKQSHNSYEVCQHETTCDLDSLVTLAIYTGSSLTHLIASLVVERPQDLDAPPPGRSLFALKSLTLQHLGVKADLVDWLSDHLAHLCPNLQSLEIGCFMIKEGHEGWKPSSSQSLKDSFVFHQACLLSTDV
ncbi:hypothetical protein FRB97_009806 [Tulasnella sp. 331]|nr:hypothetical protein FRB97_009806 [Tulasnella sp. 331]KAG8887495.1 hypothetical protein FRB98_009511 [Tulasnella sp. 332]